jgi:hypothetical protein
MLLLALIASSCLVSFPMLCTAQNALLFAGYGAGLQWSERSAQTGTTPPLWHVFVGGCAGGFAQSFLASPVELLKVYALLPTAA